MDPIYENADPISMSVRERKDNGSIATVLNVKKEQFFFTMKLVGDGCVLTVKQSKHKKNVSSVASPGVRSPSKISMPMDETMQKDPISASFKLRKAAGSVVTTCPADVFTPPIESFKLNLVGKGCKIKKEASSNLGTPNRRPIVGVMYSPTK